MVDTGASKPSKDNCHCTPAPQNTDADAKQFGVGRARMHAKAQGSTQLTLPTSRVSDNTLDAMR